VRLVEIARAGVKLAFGHRSVTGTGRG
jgi:hypothetical protein